MDFKYFSKLKNDWLDEVGFFSDPEILFSNKHYRAIIDMQFSAVPFLIGDLRNNEGYWFDALSEILDIDPVKEEYWGDYAAMANDWLEWSTSNLGI